MTAVRYCQTCRAHREPHDHAADSQSSLFGAATADERYPSTLYDGKPPSEPRDGGGTSLIAAHQITSASKTLRDRVLASICSSANGSTDDEIEIALGLRHQTASARRRELVLLGQIYDSGQRRRTSSGRAAVVWVAREAG